MLVSLYTSQLAFVSPNEDMLKLSKNVRLLKSNNMYMKLDIPKVKRESFANRSFSA